jgi:hypothetical protein
VRLENRPSAHKAHVIALTSGILFLAVVTGLKRAVLSDPDGRISDAPPFLLTLPWSFLVLETKSRAWDFVAVIFSGGVNATLVYLMVRGLIKIAGIRTASAVLVPIALLVSAAIWLSNVIEHDAPIRIVNGWQKNGMWLATDQDGLRAMAGANGIGADVSGEMRNHFIFVPNKTNGISTGGGYLLQDGRSLPDYFA